MKDKVSIILDIDGYDIMYENSNENRQIRARCLPFYNISPIYAWKITPSSWFREFAPTFEKNTPFFAKVGTGVRVGDTINAMTAYDLATWATR